MNKTMRKVLLFFLFILLPVNLFADGIITQNIINGCDVDNLKLVDNETYIFAAQWQANEYTCPPGYYLPENAIECVKCSSNHTCPGGTYTFNENISQGIMFNFILTTDFAGGCVTDYLWPNASQAKTEAIWQRNTYDCNAGYFLPTNAIECVKCSSDHTCPGGTYTFNENISQGITFSSILTTDFAGGCVNDYVNDYLIGSPVKKYAIWERSSYDCSAGYYLPADGVECVICPHNNYCPGGKYEYSETVAQGIMECPNNLFSPSGVFEVESCGRKLHIGDEILYLRSSKKTTPSLNVDINNDGIADFFGNATLQRTTINSSSQRYLHVGEYYIYDDSIRLEE